MNNLLYLKQQKLEQCKPLPQESWEPINGWLWIAAIGISWIVVGSIGYVIWHWTMLSP